MVLTVPRYEPEINTIDDVITANFETIYVPVPESGIRVRYGGHFKEEILKKVRGKLHKNIFSKKRRKLATAKNFTFLNNWIIDSSPY